MATVCESCGAVAPEGARFCPTCGAAIDPSRQTTEERKLVTVLFADVTGSTALGERLDPERLRIILAEYFDAMSTVIAGWGGTIEKYIGDAVVAVFGVPVLREDDAIRALRSAREMLERLDSLNAAFRQRHGISLAIRIGINTGVVIVPVGGTAGQAIVAGDAVNTAARLQGAAEPGTIIAGERTYLAAREAFEFSEPVEHALAGKALPVVARLVGEPRGEPTRGIPGLHADMIGRERELSTLVGLLDEAIERGEPRLAVVYGAAGIGKSRLVRELVRSAATSGPAPTTLRGRCVPAGHGITYWALTEILRTACGYQLDDPADEVRTKLETRVRDLLGGAGASDATETIGALAASAAIALPNDPLAGREPRAIDEAIGRAWPRFLSAMAAEGPLVLVIEDLHWAGGQLVETISRIATRSVGPMLVVGTARPEFAESPSILTGGGSAISAISLRPLTADQSDEVVDGLLDIADLPAAYRATIVERAEGNPFFIEEIVRRLVDEGVVVHADGRWRATAAIETIVLPDTIHALLAARIDALPSPERLVLREASVIGKVFWDEAIRAGTADLDVRTALDALEQRGLVIVRPTSTIEGATEYVFQHALVRDVAYASLPRARRARAHAAVAEWTERLAGERAEEFAELLAYHFEAAVAGEDSDLAWHAEPERRQSLRRSALAWLVSAGDGARRRYALDHAIRLHEQAVALAVDDAERVVALEALGDDHAAAFNGDLAVADYVRAADAGATIGSSSAHARLLMKAAREATQKDGTFRSIVPPGTTEGWIEAGLATAADESTRGWLLALRADMFSIWAKHEQAFGEDPLPIDERVRAAREALSLATRLDLPSLEFQALGTVSQFAERLGDFGEQRATAERAVVLADRLDPSTRVEALVFAAETVDAIDGDHVRAERLLLEAQTLVVDLSDHQRLHVIGNLVGLYYRMGRWDEAERALGDHLELFKHELDVGCYRVRMGPLMGAILHAHRGRTSESRHLLDIVPMAEHLSPYSDGLRARCLAALGAPEEALAIAKPHVAGRVLFRSVSHIAHLEALEALADWQAVADTMDAAVRDAAGDVELSVVAARIGALAGAAVGDAGAEMALTEAIERADRLELRFEAARARESLATVTADGDVRRRAGAEALAVYEDLGAAPHADRMRSNLVRS
jgi:class 3 adenylate cyclase